MRFEEHERAVICQSFHDPLITITGSIHQIAPPLMRRFMGYGLFPHQLPNRVGLQFISFLWRKECITRKEDQPGPALAYCSRHLRDRQFAIGIWAKILVVKLDGTG